MRIDGPSSSLAEMSGSFSGIFSGETTNNFLDVPLSKSLGEISSSFDKTIGDLSSSRESRLVDVSQSINQSIVDLSSSIVDAERTLSTSIDNNINSISSSLVDTIYSVSGGINTTIQNVSKSINETVDFVSESIDKHLLSVSESIETTVYSLSSSFSADRTQISSSFNQTIADTTKNLQSGINSKVSYAEYNQYTQSVDNTYYKNGSNVTTNNLVVSGSTLLRGDLFVSGTVITVHEKDVSIGDKFINIASGSKTSQEADGAGFGIDGANVSMSYNSSNDTVQFNKAIVAPGFTGSFQGNLIGTASQASDLLRDGILATALVDLKNMISLQYSGSENAASTVYLYCGNTRSFKKVIITGSIQLALPEPRVDSIEHYVLFQNTSTTSCSISIPSGCLAPVRPIGEHYNGGYAVNSSSKKYICYPNKSLGMNYISVANEVIISQVTEMG